MRFAIASLLLLSAAAAHAESRYQLQAGLTGGSYIVGTPGSPLSPIVSIGVEDGASVWLLGISGYATRGQYAAGSETLPDGTLRQHTVEATTVTVSLEPGYRRYLTDFESGFAPLVQGSVQIAAAQGSSNSPFSSSASLLGLAATAGVGGEARFGDHLAVDARVFARLSGSRRSGGDLPRLYSADVGLGTSAGVTLRF
jgi:hypothetical protein